MLKNDVTIKNLSSHLKNTHVLTTRRTWKKENVIKKETTDMGGKQLVLTFSSVSTQEDNIFLGERQ